MASGCPRSRTPAATSSAATAWRAWSRSSGIIPMAGKSLALNADFMYSALPRKNVRRGIDWMRATESKNEMWLGATITPPAGGMCSRPSILIRHSAWYGGAVTSRSQRAHRSTLGSSPGGDDGRSCARVRRSPLTAGDASGPPHADPGAMCDATPVEENAAFADLGLGASLLDALAGLGYEEPTPIQRETIPVVLAGRDVVGQAATGTGKTAAFALPVLQTLSNGGSGGRGRPEALVLVPTRELAMQVSEAI